MIQLANEKSGKIGIFGLARTGEATYLALRDYAKKIVCYDDSEKNRTEFSKKYGDKTLVHFKEDVWKELNKIVISPGVPTSLPKVHPIVELARELQIPFIGDVDLLYNARQDAHYIAITGTNGKSTTTSLIHHILSKGENKWDIGGNIGNAVLNMDQHAYGYVLELSSYQIELLQDFKAEVAILLNITPDHLDRHGTIENYTNVKKTLVQNAGTSIIGIDNKITAAIYEELKTTHNIIPISVKKIIEAGVCIKDGKIYDWMDGEQKEYIFPENKSLQGEHNYENAAASFAAAKLSGMEPEIILSQMKSFVGLLHRMQFVGTKFNIDFYNDSKATNAEAAAQSIAALKNIYWLAGGVAKSGGIESLLNLKGNITKAYLYGEAQNLFADQLEGLVPYQICNSLMESFNAALEDAKSSGARANMLLAPACASLDQFKDFEERGCHFIDLYDRI